MPTGVYPDGDWTVAHPDGPPNYSAPFPTDPKPYLYKQRYQQYRANFSALAIDAAGPFGGYHAGESDFRGEDGGVMSWNREFALLPATRSEYESFIYDYHVVFYTLGVPNFCIQPKPLRVNSRIQYDYFHTTNPGLFIPLPRAPQLMESCIGNIALGNAVSVFSPLTPSGTEVLAEEPTFKLWKANIYERKMRFIRWISTADLIFLGA